MRASRACARPGQIPSQPGEERDAYQFTGVSDQCELRGRPRASCGTRSKPSRNAHQPFATSLGPAANRRRTHDCFIFSHSIASHSIRSSRLCAKKGTMKDKDKTRPHAPAAGPISCAVRLKSHLLRFLPFCSLFDLLAFPLAPKLVANLSAADSRLIILDLVSRGTCTVEILASAWCRSRREASCERGYFQYGSSGCAELIQPDQPSRRKHQRRCRARLCAECARTSSPEDTT